MNAEEVKDYLFATITPEIGSHIRYGHTGLYFRNALVLDVSADRSILKVRPCHHDGTYYREHSDWDLVELLYSYQIDKPYGRG